MRGGATLWAVRYFPQISPEGYCGGEDLLSAGEDQDQTHGDGYYQERDIWLT